MPGIRIEPSAATSATAEPEISAKNSDAPIDTCARPPRIQPNTDEANAIRRREIPDAFMIEPARMKSGIASSGKLVAPLYVTTARFGSTSRPCVDTIATTATMPSDTAIGTLISTSPRTAAKRTSIATSALLVQSFRQRQFSGRRGWRAFTHEIDEMQDLGDDDQRRRDRNHRLHDAHRNLGDAHQRVGREDRHDLAADAAEQHEKADDEQLRDDVQDAPRRPRHRLHELRAADVRALERAERGAVEREPREQHRRDLVVPDERRADRAEHDTECHLDEQHDHQRRNDHCEKTAVSLAEPRHHLLRNEFAVSIACFAPGTCFANS